MVFITLLQMRFAETGYCSNHEYQNDNPILYINNIAAKVFTIAHKLSIEILKLLFNAVKLRRMLVAGGDTRHGWSPGLVSPPTLNLKELNYYLIIIRGTG